MSWFSKVIYGSLWIFTERTWDKKHKCWFSKEIYGYLWLLTERTWDKNHMSWFSKVIQGSLWLLTERTWDKKHKCWFSKEIYGSLWLLRERTGIKIISIGSPKLFTVLFGYSTDGSGIKNHMSLFPKDYQWFSVVIHRGVWDRNHSFWLSRA